MVAAVEKGFFAQNGVHAKGSRFKSGPECTEALLQGGADMATMGDAIANLSGQGNECPVVLVTNKKWFSRNKECRNRVVKSLADGSAWISTHSDEMATILATRSDMKVERAKKSTALHNYQIKTSSQIERSLNEIKKK